MPKESDSGKKKQLNLEDLIKKASHNRRRIYGELHRRSNPFGVEPDPTEYLIYKTHISQIHAMPDENMRYKALVMCEPEKMPEDIEQFVSEELCRIQHKSKQ